MGGKARNVLVGSFLSLLGCGVWIAQAQQQAPDFSAVEIKTVPVADGIYVLMGVGRNMGNIGSDGVLLVDSQFAPMHRKIEEALSKITNQRVRFLVNTHAKRGRS